LNIKDDLISSLIRKFFFAALYDTKFNFYSFYDTPSILSHISVSCSCSHVRIRKGTKLPLTNLTASKLPCTQSRSAVFVAHSPHLSLPFPILLSQIALVGHKPAARRAPGLAARRPRVLGPAARRTLEPGVRGCSTQAGGAEAA
jgi:hypothetical protein